MAAEGTRKDERDEKSGVDGESEQEQTEPTEEKHICRKRETSVDGTGRLGIGNEHLSFVIVVAALGLCGKVGGRRREDCRDNRSRRGAANAAADATRQSAGAMGIYRAHAQ
jgi:hypothetical protein